MTTDREMVDAFKRMASAMEKRNELLDKEEAIIDKMQEDVIKPLVALLEKLGDDLDEN